MGYMRIVTHPSVLPQPLVPADAMSNVAALISRPHVRVAVETDGFWDLYQATAGRHSRGNHVPDAHVATLMRQYGVAVIYSRDRDFRRYDGIEARDPFA
jgi:hypothetical protein